MKKLVLGLAFSFAANAAMAEIVNDITIDGFIFDLDTEAKTATLAGCEVSTTTVDIAKVEYKKEGYSVTALKGESFMRSLSLASVSLPNVTTIGTAAFLGCSSLDSVSLPSARTIEGYAFNGCTSLKSLLIPNATTIDDNAFVECSSLDSVSLPNVTTIGNLAFAGCSSLALVSLPNVTTIGNWAFDVCNSLNVICVSSAMKEKLNADRSFYGILETASIYVLLPEDVVKDAEYVVQEAVVETNVQLTVSSDVKVRPSVTLKSGGAVLDEADYEASCLAWGVDAQQKPETPEIPADPTIDDFKVVSKDAQVVGSDEIAVKETELQAAKAETVSIEGGVVSLAVGVSSNGNFTAETKDWKPVELKPENVKVENGKIVISIPVSDKSGFMILQSGDAKVGTGNNPADIIIEDR